MARQHWQGANITVISANDRRDVLSVVKCRLTATMQL